MDSSVKPFFVIHINLIMNLLHCDVDYLYAFIGLINLKVSTLSFDCKTSAQEIGYTNTDPTF